MTTVAERPGRTLQKLDAAGKVAAAGIYALPDDVYHSDPVRGGSLSASGAKKLLPPSCPAIFDYERHNPPTPTHAFDLGHAAHKLVLGIGPDVIEVKHPDWRTNAAKDEREQIRQAGGVPLLTKDYEVVQAMAEALRTHPITRVLFTESSGVAEASLFWQDESAGITRRSRLDWLPNQSSRRLVISDYKTALSAEPGQFARAAMNYGYHQQAAWYRDAVTALGISDDPAFVFVVQEKTAPYLVSVIELDVVALRIGRLLNRKAIDLYAHCTKTGIWPGYADDVELVSLPGWYENSFAEEL